MQTAATTLRYLPVVVSAAACLYLHTYERGETARQNDTGRVLGEVATTLSASHGCLQTATEFEERAGLSLRLHLLRCCPQRTCFRLGTAPYLKAALSCLYHWATGSLASLDHQGYYLNPAWFRAVDYCK